VNLIQKTDLKTKPMENKGFTIISRGDRTVGIFPQQWEIKGQFQFDNIEDKIAFMEEIRKLFESYADDSMVYDSNDLEIEREKFISNL
jgi:hypothetical protein